MIAAGFGAGFAATAGWLVLALVLAAFDYDARQWLALGALHLLRRRRRTS